VFVIIPLVLLVTFNAMLVSSVHRSRRAAGTSLMGSGGRDQSRMHLRAQQEIRLTILLIAVVTVFLCCQMPTAVVLILSFFWEPVPHTVVWHKMNMLRHLFNLLMGINASVNFVLYAALSKKYRREFCYEFCRWCKW
jgi:hypothetical protein